MGQIKHVYKEMVAEATLKFVAKELTLGKDGGDISIVDPETGYIYICPRPSKSLKIFSWATITPEQIAVIDIKGHVVDPEGPNPTIEYPMHLAIYKARPDIRAIIHSHALWSTVFACAQKSIPSVCVEMDHEILCTPYERAGSEALANAIVECLGEQGKQALLCNHGAVACGRDIDEAFIMSDYMERQAQIVLYAELIGGAKRVRHEDMLDPWVERIADELTLY